MGLLGPPSNAARRHRAWRRPWHRTPLCELSVWQTAPRFAPVSPMAQCFRRLAPIAPSFCAHRLLTGPPAALAPFYAPPLPNPLAPSVCFRSGRRSTEIPPHEQNAPQDRPKDKKMPQDRPELGKHNKIRTSKLIMFAELACGKCDHNPGVPGWPGGLGAGGRRGARGERGRP